MVILFHGIEIFRQSLVENVVIMYKSRIHMWPVFMLGTYYRWSEGVGHKLDTYHVTIVEACVVIHFLSRQRVSMDINRKVLQMST